MENSDNPRNKTDTLSQTEIKQLKRELNKTWHPDKATDLGFAEDPKDVTQTINGIFSGLAEENLESLKFWPSNFTSDTQVKFPAFLSGEPGRTIFIPRTPEDFFTLLQYIKNNKTFPKKEFPQVRIAQKGEHESDDRERGGRDQNRADFDAEFEKYVNSLRDNKSIDDLMLKARALAILPPGYAEANKLDEVIDLQGEYLLNADFATAKDLKQFSLLFKKLEEFPFTNSELQAKVRLVGIHLVKELFMQKMKSAVSESGLDTLLKELDQFHQQNILAHEDRDEISNWIEKKRAVYASKWTQRKERTETPEGA